jgi:hypothetical protein
MIRQDGVPVGNVEQHCQPVATDSIDIVGGGTPGGVGGHQESK